MTGVPKSIRQKVSDRFEEDAGKRGGKEYYFELLNYKKIILDNWDTFEQIFAYGNKGNKEKRMAWLDYINLKCRIVSHASSAVTLSIEELEQLEEYKDWLNGKINCIDNIEDIG